MPTPPTGEWEDVLTLPPQDSRVVAIHACVLHNGKVLYFHCRSYPFWTRLYDPESNEVILDDLEKLVVPKWPIYYEADPPDPAYPIQPSKIFCSGHCFLPNGKLLVAGGELNNPYPDSYEPIAPDRGLRYSSIFSPDSVGVSYWSITGSNLDPHIMKYGRWYPTLTLLHNGTVLAMAGLNDDVINYPFFNRLAEIYDPNVGWIPLENEQATLPYDIHYSYPYAHVIPFGPRVGKVFYASTQLVAPSFQEAGYSQIFDPFAHDPYWEPVSNRRPTPSEASTGVFLPIRYGSNSSRCAIIVGFGKSL